MIKIFIIVTFFSVFFYFYGKIDSFYRNNMREENPVTIRLDNTSKTRCAIVFIISILLLLIAFFLAIFVTPSIMKSKEISYGMCAEIGEIQCIANQGEEIFYLNIINVDNFNQLLLFEAYYISNQTVNSEININFTLSGGKDSTLIANKNKNLAIECDNNDCKSSTIFYVPYIYYSAYALSIQVNNKIPVETIIFKLSYINKEYTKFELGVKSSFLVLSLISIAVLLCSLRKVPFRF